MRHYVVITGIEDASSVEDVGTVIVLAENICGALPLIKENFDEYDDGESPEIILEVETGLRFDRNTHPEYFTSNF